MNKKISGTFIIYMGSRQAIYPNIAASRSNFFRPRQQNSLRKGRALGNFVASDELRILFRILLRILLRILIRILLMILLMILRRILIRTCRARSARREGA